MCREENWFNFMLVKHTQERIIVSEGGYSWSYDLHMHCQPHILICLSFQVSRKSVGDTVNIEADVLGKCVYYYH